MLLINNFQSFIERHFQIEQQLFSLQS